MQQQPWMQNPNQQYQQPGYPNNQQQPGFGQQGNPTQSGQFYGGYPGYQQGYGNMNMPGYSQNDENQIDEEAAKRKRLYIILGAVLLFIIALIVFIIIIDTNYLWCDVFPFLWSAEACAIYRNRIRLKKALQMWIFSRWKIGRYLQVRELFSL